MPKKKMYPRVAVYSFRGIWCTVALKGYQTPAGNPQRWTSFEEALREGIDQAERIKAIRNTRGFM